MVAVFRRCPSPPAISSSSCSGQVSANHVRSVSVPCCSHPALSNLQNEIRSLRTLPACRGPSFSEAEWVADGFHRIGRVHAALDHLLHLSRAAQGRPLGGLLPTSAPAGALADRLLDDALCLADAYGSLLSVADELKHHAAEARAAIRRGDSARLSAAVRSLRRVEKDLGRLAAGIKNVSKSFHPVDFDLVVADAADVELAGVIKEAVAVTATASVAIVTAVETQSSSSAAALAATILKDSTAAWSLKRIAMPKPYRKAAAAAAAEIEAHEKLESLGKSLERLEEGSEKVFRKLVNTRVSLLNIFAPSLL